MKPRLCRSSWRAFASTHPLMLPSTCSREARSVLAALFSPPSFLLFQTLWQIWQELSSLSSCSIRLQWVPGHLFLPGNDKADELVKRGALLAPSAIPCSLYLLLSLVSTLVFSRTGGVLSHRSSLTHRSIDFHRGTCAPSSCSLYPLSSLLQWTQPSFRFLPL